MAAASADDMDLFVAIQKVDRNGEPVGFHYYASFDTGPVALGWLRASHRELDAAKSTPERPIQRIAARIAANPAKSCRWRSRSGPRPRCSARASACGCGEGFGPLPVPESRAGPAAGAA